jgi:hypothetical protein
MILGIMLAFSIERDVGIGVDVSIPIGASVGMDIGVAVDVRVAIARAALANTPALAVVVAHLASLRAPCAEAELRRAGHAWTPFVLVGAGHEHDP